MALDGGDELAQGGGEALKVFGGGGSQIGEGGFGRLDLADGKQQRSVIDTFSVGDRLARGGIPGQSSQQIASPIRLNGFAKNCLCLRGER